MDQARSRFGTLAARVNCPPDWGTREKCPECGQFHLRPGYCQARNPQATAAIGSGKKLSMDEARRLASLEYKPKVETLNETLRPDETVNETLSEPIETLTQAGETLSAVEGVTGTCSVCGTNFAAARSTAKYCSAACRLKAHRGA